MHTMTLLDIHVCNVPVKNETTRNVHMLLIQETSIQWINIFYGVEISDGFATEFQDSCLKRLLKSEPSGKQVREMYTPLKPTFI